MTRRVRPAPRVEHERGTDWRDQAACRNHDDNLFFLDDFTGTAAVQATEQAKTICAECPVRQPCLHFALTKHIPYGVFGGLTADERGHTGIRYCERCQANPIDLDSRAKYCADCRPVVRKQRWQGQRRKKKESIT